MEGNETETENITQINERQEKENETQNVIFEMEAQTVKENETENRENEKFRENNESYRIMLEKEQEDRDGENGESDYTINEPIITRPDRMILEKEQIEKDLREGQEGRITSDVGGRHFATSQKMLLKAMDSLFNILLQWEETLFH